MKDTFIILTPGFPKDENDTTCTPFVQSFIKALARLYPDLEIIVLALDYPFTNEPYYWNTIQVLPFNHHNSRGLKRFVQLYFVYRKLRSLGRTKKVIGILSFWLGYTALIGHYYSKFNKIKHHCWLHGQDAKKGNGILRFMKPKGSELIALSLSMKQEFFASYNIEIQYTVPIGVETGDFSHVGEPEKTIDIIGVGSLLPLKQWQFFIDVIAAVVKNNPGLKCILCGDGPEKEKIVQLIKHHDLTTVITLTGLITHHEVLSLMSKSKILLHPSAYEGYGNVFTEALYAGCHCISFVDPEQKKVQNWHIVNTKEEMITKCNEVLRFSSTSFFSVKLHDIKDCVYSIMELYTL